MRLISVILLAGMATSACAASVDPSADVDSESTELSASTALGLKLDAANPVRGLLTLRGTTKLPLANLTVYVSDDEIGSNVIARNKKSFTTTIEEPGLVPWFLGAYPIRYAARTTAGKDYQARVEIRATASSVQPGQDFPWDANDLGLPATFETYRIGTNLVVRVGAAIPIAGDRINNPHATIQGVVVTGTSVDSRWSFDFPANLWARAIVAKERVTLNGADDVSGDFVTFSFVPSFAVTKIAVGANSPADPKCSAAMRACLAKSANAVDTSACGNARAVQSCR